MIPQLLYATILPPPRPFVSISFSLIFPVSLHWCHFTRSFCVSLSHNLSLSDSSHYVFSCLSVWNFMWIFPPSPLGLYQFTQSEHFLLNRPYLYWVYDMIWLHVSINSHNFAFHNCLLAHIHAMCVLNCLIIVICYCSTYRNEILSLSPLAIDREFCFMYIFCLAHAHRHTRTHHHAQTFIIFVIQILQIQTNWYAMHCLNASIFHIWNSNFRRIHSIAF